MLQAKLMGEKKELISVKNTPQRQGKDLAKEKSVDDSRVSIERSLKDIDLILSSSKAAIDQRMHYGSQTSEVNQVRESFGLSKSSRRDHESSKTIQEPGTSPNMRLPNVSPIIAQISSQDSKSQGSRKVTEMGDTNHKRESPNFGAFDENVRSALI